MTVPARSTTEFQVKGKTEERTEWRGQNESKIEEEKWQTCWCCRDQQRACRMAQASAEKLEHIGPAEKERVASVPQREQMARTPEPPLARGKGTKPSLRALDHEGGESQGGCEPHLGKREEGIRARAWREKDGLHREGRQIPKRTERASQARRASLGEVEGSMSG